MRQEERSARARRQILDAARAAFVERGYDGAALEDIIALAGVSKGGLYHHFANKQAVFAGVFEEVARETLEAAYAAGQTVASPMLRLLATVWAWLEAVEHGVPRRILLEEGARALGFAKARALEAPYADRLVRKLIDEAVAAGEAHCPDPELAAALINAAVAELVRARMVKPDRAASAERATLEGLVRGVIGAQFP